MFRGARYFDVEALTTCDLTAEISVAETGVKPPSQGDISKDVTLSDSIVGVRGQFDINDKWSSLYYADVGAGDSDLTWNVYLGLARQYGWGELLLAYRHLEYDQGDDSLLQGFSFSGPAIGARFRF